MPILKIVKNLQVLAAMDSFCYVAFRNKDDTRKLAKLPCEKGEKPDSIRDRYKHLEAKYGKITVIMDTSYNILAEYEESKPKYYKVIFTVSDNSSKEIEQVVPFESTDKLPNIIAKAMKLLKANGLTDKLGNVKSIEDSQGVVIFDPVRDLRKKFGG
jgi:mevalonate kinase